MLSDAIIPKTLVSVIIPTYNAEAVLERAVRSVEQQEVETEIIVADDASTDATVAIARDLGCVVLTAETNSGGPNRGRNTAMEAARGEWIALLDQDEEFLPGKLAAQLRASSHGDILSTGYVLRDLSTGYVEERSGSTGEIITMERGEAYAACLRREYDRLPYINSIMFRREHREPFEERFGQLDYDWRLRILKDRSTANVDLPLVVRYVDGSNLSLDPTYRRRDFCYGLLALLECEQEHMEDVEIGIRRTLGTHARFHYTQGNMREARRYFRMAGLNTRHLAYYLTSYVGSSVIRRHFRIFG